jgi:hypothetical protein
MPGVRVDDLLAALGAHGLDLSRVELEEVVRSNDGKGMPTLSAADPS